VKSLEGIIIDGVRGDEEFDLRLCFVLANPMKN
jgi:hypothetical protein